MVRKTKGLYRAVSLRGQTQGVLGNLGGGVSHYYFILVNAFEERFLPTNQIELYRAQLREKRQKATGTLPELGQSIRRLNYLAYPSAPIDVRETLAKEEFFLLQYDLTYPTKSSKTLMKQLSKKLISSQTEVAKRLRNSPVL